MMEEGVVMMVEEEVTSKRAEQWRTERTVTKGGRGGGMEGGDEEMIDWNPLSDDARDEAGQASKRSSFFFGE